MDGSKNRACRPLSMGTFSYFSNNNNLRLFVMRKLSLYFSFLTVVLSFTHTAAGGKFISPNLLSADSSSVHNSDAAYNLLSLKVKDIERLTGKKFTLKEKLVLKIYKSKLKKEKRKAGKEPYSKRSKTAFILSILSLATIIIFPVSVVLAIISIVMASKALHEKYNDKKARTAMTLSFLALGLVVVTLLVYAIFVSDGEFGIFVL